MARDGQERDRESGMVSAELAVSLVTLLLVLAMVLGAVRAGMDRAASVSVAGAIAREAARGGVASAVWQDLRDGLPAGSSMALWRDGAMVTATVSVPVRVGLASVVLPDRMSVRAVARMEDP